MSLLGRFLSRTPALTVVLGAFLVVSVPAAHSSDGPCEGPACEEGGDVVINPNDPGTPGTPGNDGNGGGGGNTGTPTCTANEREIPCVSPDGGVWYAPYGCYLTLAPAGGLPPPDAANPNGAWYLCQPYGLPPTTVWLDNPPEELPSPGELAQEALERMDLEPIQIGIVPEDGPGRIGLVGMPVWMWVENPTASTFGPITESATAGSLTVTATARVESTVWSMGDGNEVTCTTVGTPYQDKYGESGSPDCGHRYVTTSWDEPRHRYTITATTQWVVEWTGGGQTGTIPIDHVAEAQIRVGELQVLNQ